MASFVLRRVEDAFWRQVKSKAAAEGVTVKAKILQLLADWINT